MIINLPSELAGLIESIQYRLVRYIALDGGRSSSKSTTCIRALIVVCSTVERRVLACREYDDDIALSIHKLIGDTIYALGLENFWVITKDVIRCPSTKTEIYFSGLQRPDSIKSAEAIDIVIIEEAAKVKKFAMRKLIPTIRKRGSIIITIHNPDWLDDYIYDYTVTNGHLIASEHKYYHRSINYLDHCFNSEETLKEAELCRKMDHELYEHEWLGKPRSHNKQQVFFEKFESRAFDLESEEFTKDIHSPDFAGSPRFYYGVYFGYSEKPTAAVRIFEYKDCLYIDHCAGGIGLELNEIADEIKKLPDSNRAKIFACPSLPATLYKIIKIGKLKISAAEKWENDNIDAIKYLRGNYKKIIIHPRCSDVLENFNRFWWNLDEETGDVMNVLIDKHNEYFHAIRHALTYRIKGGM